jgi:N-acetylglucosaminyldiphosphoundecaprenol N-acetyl-beta-D-mannosaminyltransferase
MLLKKINILGINFISGQHEDVLNKCLNDGGYVIAPSSPTLVHANEDEYFYECFLDANNAILDSGFLVLIWNFLKSDKIIKFSGLSYLRLLLKKISTEELQNTLWILPDTHSINKTKTLIAAKSEIFNFYVSPKYPAKGPIFDSELLEIIKNKKPKHVIIGLGGGTQERLAKEIRDISESKTCIHCIGGALGFLNKTQIYIPEWADFFYLGWLFRCCYKPHIYVPRYWRALKLLTIALKGLEKPLNQKKAA